MSLISEVKQAKGKVIVFIDELHTLIGACGGSNALDAANIIKSALARGEFMVCIIDMNMKMINYWLTTQVRLSYYILELIIFLLSLSFMTIILMQCIGAMTPYEYRKYIEQDTALQKRFQSVRRCA